MCGPGECSPMPAGQAVNAKALREWRRRKGRLRWRAARCHCRRPGRSRAAWLASTCAANALQQAHRSIVAPATELRNGRTRARETLVAGGDMPLRQGDTLIPGVASAGGPPWPPVYAQHHERRAPSRLLLSVLSRAFAVPPVFTWRVGFGQVVRVLIFVVDWSYWRANGGCQTPCLVISACAVAETALASTPLPYSCTGPCPQLPRTFSRVKG